MTRTFTAPDGTTVAVQGVHNCCSCKTLKPASELYKDASRRTGISSRCKPCSQARMRAIPALQLMKTLKAMGEKNPVVRDIIRTTARQLGAAA